MADRLLEEAIQKLQKFDQAWEKKKTKKPEYEDEANKLIDCSRGIQDDISKLLYDDKELDKKYEGVITKGVKAVSDFLF